MTTYDFFVLGINIATNPNKIYRRGWDDAMNGHHRYQFRLAFLFKAFKESQRLYDEGYKDGNKERMLRNTNTRFVIVENNNP